MEIFILSHLDDFLPNQHIPPPFQGEERSELLRILQVFDSVGADFSNTILRMTYFQIHRVIVVFTWHL